VTRLLGWLEWAEYQSNAVQKALQGTRGNLFVYEDCAVWSHPNKAASKERLLTTESKTKLLEQGYQDAGLSPEELLGKHKDNWRVWNEEIARAWLEESYISPGLGIESDTVASGPGVYAADLQFGLIDGTTRKLRFRRVDADDHAVRKRFESWLGDRLEIGKPPAGKGLKGLLTKVNRPKHGF
jgi:hypothetical protein